MPKSVTQQKTTKTRGRKSKTAVDSKPLETTDSAQPSTTNGKKTSKVKSADHPKFINMVIESIKNLNENDGASRQAILKYILANYDVEEKSANQYLKVALKNGVKSGKLKQVRGVGASGSFKIAEKGAKQTKSIKPVKVSLKKPKIASKEVAKSQLPSSVPKSRKPPTERELVVAKKPRTKKEKTKPTEVDTPVSITAETVQELETSDTSNAQETEKLSPETSLPQNNTESLEQPQVESNSVQTAITSSESFTLAQLSTETLAYQTAMNTPENALLSNVEATHSQTALDSQVPSQFSEEINNVNSEASNPDTAQSETKPESSEQIDQTESKIV